MRLGFPRPPEDLRRLGVVWRLLGQLLGEGPAGAAPASSRGGHGQGRVELEGGGVVGVREVDDPLHPLPEVKSPVYASNVARSIRPKITQNAFDVFPKCSMRSKSVPNIGSRLPS